MIKTPILQQALPLQEKNESTIDYRGLGFYDEFNSGLKCPNFKHSLRIYQSMKKTSIFRQQDLEGAYVPLLNEVCKTIIMTVFWDPIPCWQYTLNPKP